MSHPSDLKLERHLLDPARSPVAGHVAECERCRARLAEMEEQGESFRRFVYPATVENVTGRRWRPMQALWLLAPAAGLAAVLLIARRGPTSDYIATKGAALTMTAYVALPSGPRTLADGDSIPASSSLRFRVRTAQPCMLALISVDAAGQLSKLYTQDVSGDAALPGGIHLDGKKGPERFFAVCAGPAGYDAVEQAARRIGDVRQNRALPGVEGPQASLLIEKTP